MMSKFDSHRISIIGKVRSTIGGYSLDSRSQSLDKRHSRSKSSDASEEGFSFNITHKGSIGSLVAKKKRGMWLFALQTQAKDLFIPVPVLPPALTLAFEKGSQDKNDTVCDPPIATLNKKGRGRSILRLKKDSYGQIASTDGASEAAAIALAAVSNPVSAAPKIQIEYHQNARLSVHQATALVQYCSQQIKMRGE
jgi:hypothetical protein